MNTIEKITKYIQEHKNKAKITTAAILTTAVMASCGGPRAYKAEGTNLQGENVSYSYLHKHGRMNAIIENDSIVKYIYGDVKTNSDGTIDTIIWDGAVKEYKQNNDMIPYSREQLSEEQVETIQNDFWKGYKTVKALFGSKIAGRTEQNNPDW